MGHVIHKVRDLDRAVADFEARGFAVEYGRAKKPCNALIYFSHGPYLELLARTGMPPLLGRLLSLGPRGGAARRFLSWDRGPEGLCGLCLEGDDRELREAMALLGGKGLRIRTKRVDTHARELRYEAFFPQDVDLPFLMSHFSTDPRPQGFTHPNGISAITRVAYPLPASKRDTVLRLSDDPGLELVEPGGAFTIAFDDGSTL
nr:VOC family protein [Actinomyces bowdenii]